MPKLPKYVIEVNGEWFVRRYFSTGQTYLNGAPRYIQVKRKCETQTPEHAKVLSLAIETAMVAPSNNVTLGEFLATYINSKRNSVSIKTVELIEDYFRRYIGSLAAVPLTQITAMQIQRHYSAINRTPSVMHKFHKCLSAAFNQAVKWDVMAKNPCRGVILPKLNKKDIVAFDQEQARAFIDECRKDDKYLVLQFMLETALRPGEVVALRWADVDLKKCTATVSRAVARGQRGGGFVIKEPKTKKSRRTVDFSVEIRDKLFALPKSKLIFPSREGTPMAVQNLNNRLFKPLAKKMGIDCSIYSLRHTAITLALAGGAHIKAVSEWAGHEDIQTTLGTYSHVLPSMKKEVGQKLNEALYTT